MIRLVTAELRAGWASWVGVILVCTIAAANCGVAISMAETGLRAGGDYASGLSGGTAALLMFGAPSAIAVVAAVTRLAVGLARPRYAQWQLAGVAPGQTTIIVMSQLVAASLVGAVLGLGVTALAAEPIMYAAFEREEIGYGGVPVVVGPLTVGVTVPVAVLLAALGGWGAARAAGRTSPLAALREPETHGKRMRWWRWLILLAVWGGAAAFFIALRQAPDSSTFMAQGPLVPVVLTVVLVAAGPVLYPWLLRGWTALIPARASTTWYLARHQARYHLSRSTASITPLFTGVALLGGLFTMSATVDRTLRAAGEPGVTLGLWQVLLLIGGPLLLAAVGAAVVIFMSNRTQGSEQALLLASGATTGVVLGSAVMQAMIHVVTATLLGGIVIVATALATASGMARFATPLPVIDVGAALVLAGAGLVLTVTATVVPVLSRARGSVVAPLAAA